MTSREYWSGLRAKSKLYMKFYNKQSKISGNNSHLNRCFPHAVHTGMYTVGFEHTPYFHLLFMSPPARSGEYFDGSFGRVRSHLAAKHLDKAIGVVKQGPPRWLMMMRVVIVIISEVAVFMVHLGCFLTTTHPWTVDHVWMICCWKSQSELAETIEPGSSFSSSHRR